MKLYKREENKLKKKTNIINYFKQKKNRINKKTLNTVFNNSIFDNDINENNHIKSKIMNNCSSKKKKKLSLTLNWDYENPCDK